MAVHRPDLGLLERQVRSLQHQEVPDWECVVGIDGHDPETHRHLLELVAADPRFAVHHFDDNLGVYRHFERLLALVPTSEGVSWVALADQDDHWYPGKLARLLPTLAEPGVTAVVGQARVVSDGRDEGITERHVGGFASTLLINQVTGSLAVFRSDVVAASLPFPPGNDAAIHDHWLAVCATARGRVVQVDEVVQDYVQHGGNVIGESGRHTLKDALAGLRDAGAPLRFVDAAVGSRWAWRVRMARASRARAVPAGEARFVDAVANGHLALAILGALASGVRRREVTPLEAVAFVIAAARWPWTPRYDAGT
ncbi:glycosyltransferase [Pedococcus sp. 2YAF34]|uniref:glycosyltransferase n=1 Tax=Pedococcus sp. 2YAF34 TaxID=3233032 RepID=UPI003F9C983C